MNAFGGHLDESRRDGSSSYDPYLYRRGGLCLYPYLDRNRYFVENHNPDLDYRDHFVVCQRSHVYVLGPFDYLMI